MEIIKKSSGTLQNATVKAHLDALSYGIFESESICLQHLVVALVEQVRTLEEHSILGVVK